MELSGTAVSRLLKDACIFESVRLVNFYDDAALVVLDHARLQVVHHSVALAKLLVAWVFAEGVPTREDSLVRVDH